MNDLRHPLKAGVVQLRAAILASNAAITEHVKWNAPSFCYGGTDRVTSRLRPGDRLQLIFHRGATTRPAPDPRPQPIDQRADRRWIDPLV
jgi:hypothetical protein